MFSKWKCAGGKEVHRRFLFKQLLWAENISSKANCLKSHLKDFLVVWVMLMTLLDIVSSHLAPLSMVELRLFLMKAFRQSVGRTRPETELCVIVIGGGGVATIIEQRGWFLKEFGTPNPNCALLRGLTNGVSLWQVWLLALLSLSAFLRVSFLSEASESEG